MKTFEDLVNEYQRLKARHVHLARKRWNDSPKFKPETIRKMNAVSDKMHDITALLREHYPIETETKFRW